NETTSHSVSLPQFVLLGIEHILTGYDHIVFLMTVLLAAGAMRNVLVSVTGFTLGHSLTLSLAVLGMAHPDRRMIEALIGLTIALVAIESATVRVANARAVPLLTAVLIAAIAAVAS